MRNVLLLTVLCACLAIPAAAQDSDTCDPPFTSWGTPTLACGAGKTCADLFGQKLEVLHVAGSFAYVRDIDKRFCAFELAARQDVIYATDKAFKFADCWLPLWRIEEEFGAYPKACFPRTLVIVVKGGLVTLATPSAAR